MHRVTALLAAGGVIACAACSTPDAPDELTGTRSGEVTPVSRDPHSYARPDEVAIRHLDLDLEVDFEGRTLGGTASLDLDRADGSSALWLDSWRLDVTEVRGADGEALAYEIGDEQPHLGSPLHIELRPGDERLTIEYRTSPEARALQWLDGAQTASGGPFLFTQSQAILARSWIPLQDTPGVRFTYEARLGVPAGLLALMSAENPQTPAADGRYTFRMRQPIPSYLMALAVGELSFRAISERCGVYAEPPVVDAAAYEFADTEAMIAAAERLYGAYRWERYDLLVLPPSFPFGGMENPRLTFLTPTVLAGDRSLVALIAHELAHSWSGNLVTNADWNDFWLNEGFTTYFEQRIMEEVYGRDYSEMLAVLIRGQLEDEIAGLDTRDTHLHLDLAGRDPDEGMTSIAYDKGYFFLRMLEEAVGRERWDAFLGRYFQSFAFESMTSVRFLDYLQDQLLAGLSEEERASLRIDDWVYGPGLPANMPQPESPAFTEVEAQVDRLLAGTPAAELDTDGWETQRTLHFIDRLPSPMPGATMEDLDREFGFTDSGNSEILAAWLGLAIRSSYEPAWPALESFLKRQGRRKFLRPLYEAMALDETWRRRALEVYRQARPRYHSVSASTIDEVLGYQADGGP